MVKFIVGNRLTFSLENPTFEELQIKIAQNTGKNFILKYFDDECDIVCLESEKEFQAAIQQFPNELHILKFTSSKH